MELWLYNELYSHAQQRYQLKSTPEVCGDQNIYLLPDAHEEYISSHTPRDDEKMFAEFQTRLRKNQKVSHDTPVSGLIHVEKHQYIHSQDTTHSRPVLTKYQEI